MVKSGVGGAPLFQLFLPLHSSFQWANGTFSLFPHVALGTYHSSVDHLPEKRAAESRMVVKGLEWPRAPARGG